MLLLPGRTFSVKPSAVHAYFDKIQFWLRQPLDRALQNQLRQAVGHLHVEDGRARFDPKLVQRGELKQPSEEALHWVANRDDACVNIAEMALDFVFDNAGDTDDAYDFLDHHLVRDWHGAKQAIRKHDNDQRGTRYDAGRWAPNLIGLYREKDCCRVTGELYCLHLEWRANGAPALRRAGLKTSSDLVGFDHAKFWRRRLKLFEPPSPERLGRLVRNGRRGGSKKGPIVTYRLSGGRSFSFQSR